jgi:hypothetical protein
MTSQVVLEYDEEFARHVIDTDNDEGRSTSELVVYGIAQVTDTDPTSLRPLGEVIDPDALDTIFDRNGAGELGDAHLSFGYEGHEVTVFNHGRITISEQA